MCSDSRSNVDSSARCTPSRVRRTRSGPSTAPGEGGRLLQPLGEPDPRHPPVGQQEVRPVGELEVGARGRARAARRPPASPASSRPSGLMAPNMSATGGVGQRPELLRRLVAEGEVAADHLQDQVVDDVEEVGHGRRRRVGDAGPVGALALDRPHAPPAATGWAGRSRGSAARTAQVLVEHGLEAAVVGAVDVAGCAPSPCSTMRSRHLQRRLEVGGPATSSGHPNDSGAAWAHGGPMKRPSSPSRSARCAQPVLERAVELALGGEVLRPRAGARSADIGGGRLADGREGGGVARASTPTGRSK